MPIVYIPAPLRTLTGGETKVIVEGGTLREVLDRLDETYPGLKNRLVDGDRMASGMAVFVDGATPTTGLRAKLSPESEVYFAPAIAGG
jgi:molybdopterin synthase sulfur carrier subunit